MIPVIDSELGLNVYSTKFSGTNGKIKQNNEDFEVSEIISDKALNTISEETGFAVYNLELIQTMCYMMSKKDLD